MHPVPVNYLAILVSAAAIFAIGAVWHGPLFGKQWAKLEGFTAADMKAQAKRGMAWRYAVSAVGWLLMCWVLGHAALFAGTYMKMKGVPAGLMTGFMSWLGFVAPVTVGIVLWEGKSWKLWLINNGYLLLALLAAGAILGAWR